MPDFTKQEVRLIFYYVLENLAKNLKNNDFVRNFMQKSIKSIKKELLTSTENSMDLTDAFEETLKNAISMIEAKKITFYHDNPPCCREDYVIWGETLIRIMENPRIKKSFELWCEREKKLCNEVVFKFFEDSDITNSQAMEVVTLMYCHRKLQAVKLYFDIKSKYNCEELSVANCSKRVEDFTFVSKLEFLKMINEEQITGKVKNEQ